MSKKDFNHLDRWLPAKLKAAGLTVERLSQLANVSRASVYFWMQDRDRPTEQAMLRVCRVLDVPFEEGLAQYVPKKPGRPKGKL